VKYFLFVLFIFVSFSVSFGQTSKSRFNLPPEKANPVVIPKLMTPPVIDGRLDDEIWKNAAVFTDFYQIQPGDNIPPTNKTIAYVGYDENHLYVGYHAFDEPDKIRATVAKRDQLFDEDTVRMTLDTFNDQRRAYVLYFNALGIQADSILTDSSQQGADFSVDIVMESKGVILSDGYSVEVKIPFKSLRFAAGKGKLWGFNVGRQIPRLNDENNSWMPISREISSLQQIGKITGLNDVRTERSIEIVPSITLGQSGERIAAPGTPDGSRFSNGGLKQDIGVSVKYQITPNITLDAAVNPDFAEVEADAPVVRANERFPIFFAEKRPFFLEGIEIFRTPLQVVNTRNIADPDVAVKLTGKTGRNTFGLFSAIDRFPNTDTRAYVGVMRLRRDIGEQSNIGIIASTYHFGSKRHNNLFGFDGKFQTSKNANFNFQVVGTNSRRFFYNPDNNLTEYRTGNGFAYNVNYDYTGKNRGYLIGVSGRSKDYRADVGFTRRTNNHRLNGGWRIGTEPDSTKSLIGLTTRTFLGMDFDESGRIQNANANFNTSWNFKNQLEFGTETGIVVERIYEDEFGPRRNALQSGAFFGENFRGATQFFGEFDVDKTFNKRVSLSAEIGFATNELDLDFGASERFPRVSPAALLGIDRQDPGEGFLFNYNIGLELQPTDPWSVELNYERQKLKRNDTGLTAFDSNIFSLRSTYQFTRFTFLRTRMDYDTVDGSMNSQFLFGWSPNPGTAIYAGYNDNSSYRGFNEFKNQFDNGFRRDGSRFFIRLSYLFRKSL
jgi:ribosome modulation factor